MNTFELTPTNNTPAVRFGEDGKLVIEGRSIAENARNFYQPLIVWAGVVHMSRLIIDINLEYVNSSSSKKLLSLLKALDRNSQVQEIIVNWHYEEGDEDALMKGQLYEESMAKARFSFHSSKEAA
jgi:hypothetical protein